jgi:hypothetical protein
MGVPHTGPGIPGPAFEPAAAGDPAAVSGHRIDGRLGHSALGAVHLAQAPGGQPVALTVVRPELAGQDGFQALFHRAAQAAGQVHAPSLVPVLGSGREGERYWIAAAFLPAATLRAAVAGPLTGAGPLPTRVVLRLVAGLTDALRALHDAGLVHGDLRPAHVLLAADGPKLKDYGFSGLPGFAQQDGEQPAFLSPEQVAGRPATAATDVFALGQVAAYAAIGATPFGGVPSRVQQEEPDLNELPGELREIVTRCLIKDPALRPSLAQVATMCRQAAPAARTPHPPAAWLPPHLLTPHYPPAVPAAPAVPPQAVPAGPATPAAPATPVRATPVPDAQSPAGPPGAEPLPGGLQVFKGPKREGPISDAQPPAPAAAPAPVPPAPASVAGPAAPVVLPSPPPPPAPPAHRPPWPPHVHLPRRPLPRRGGVGVVAVLAGVALAVTAGVALAGGFTDPHEKDFGAAVPTAPASASAASPPSAAPPPAASSPSVTVTPPVQSGGADLYQDVHLPAGDALSLRESPPLVRTGPYGGEFGYTERADAFVSDVGRSTLSPLDPSLPPTLDSCTAAAVRATSIPRDSLSDGSRICVHSVDGTVALVTVRQLWAPSDAQPFALLDVAVWPVAGRNAEGDQ